MDALAEIDSSFHIEEHRIWCNYQEVEFVLKDFPRALRDQRLVLAIKHLYNRHWFRPSLGSARGCFRKVCGCGLRLSNHFVGPAFRSRVGK